MERLAAALRNAGHEDLIRPQRVPAADIRDLIERARRAGVTPTELARKAGLNEGTLSELANGRQASCYQSTEDKVRDWIEARGL